MPLAPPSPAPAAGWPVSPTAGLWNGQDCLVWARAFVHVWLSSSLSTLASTPTAPGGASIGPHKTTDRKGGKNFKLGYILPQFILLWISPFTKYSKKTNTKLIIKRQRMQSNLCVPYNNWLHNSLQLRYGVCIKSFCSENKGARAEMRLKNPLTVFHYTNY